MEPWCGDSNQHWGVKTWGIWATPDEEKFLQVRTHKNCYNNCFWQLSATYNDLKTKVIEKTKLMSSICSSKYFDPGHIKRIDFLKFIESKNDDLIRVDIYNTDNVHNFKGYKGPHPSNCKDVGITPYKYYFMPENNIEDNFITEKMWEPLLTETLTFYWGCPNVSQYIDPRAYIAIDLNDFGQAFNIIRNAIVNNEWEKRIEFIRMEKQKVLEYFNFFPTMERVLCRDFKFDRKPSDNDIKYHKYFNKTLSKKLSNIVFIHSTENNMKSLGELINSMAKYKCEFDCAYIIHYGKTLACEMDNIVTSKINIINYSKNIENSSEKTLNLVKLFSQYNKDSKVLYFDIVESNDIMDDLVYLFIKNYKLCFDLLSVYDVIGCNTIESKSDLINIWYGNTKHINKLENVNTISKLEDTDNKYVLWTLNNDPCESPEFEELISSFYEFDDKTRIKCVNLERRQDRKVVMSALLKQLGLTNYCDFFQAVDGSKLTSTPELEKLFQGNDFGAKRGVVGCALSHLELWNQLVKDPKYDNYLVLEDDIIVDIDLRFKLNQMFRMLPNNWDIIYFGFHMYKKNRATYESKISKLNGINIIPYDTNLTIGGTFGYIVNKRGASKFVEFTKTNGIKHGIDYLMFHYGKEMDLNQYELVPQIVYSEFVESGGQVDSDIQYDGNKLF
jgi:GR25 family glycosyltransferase involved in LPS biosynthesis